MERPHDTPEVIQLADLPKEYHRLSFLIDINKAHLKRKMDLSIKAGEIVGQIYDAILKQYHAPTAESTLKSLNMLCIRLVFCLYAEDSGIFVKDQFHDYLAQFEAKQLRNALINLFKGKTFCRDVQHTFIKIDIRNILNFAGSIAVINIDCDFCGPNGRRSTHNHTCRIQFENVGTNNRFFFFLFSILTSHYFSR